MHHHKTLNAPWSLEFDQDGTENIGIISDSDGHELVQSRPFWLPEADDPVPPTLAALRLMMVAPKLLIAAKATLAALVDDPATFAQSDSTAEPLAFLRAVITEAEEGVGAV